MTSSEKSVPIPDHIDWFMWRVLSSDRLQVSRVELLTCWTLEDVLDAHEVLDLYLEAGRGAE